MSWYYYGVSARGELIISRKMFPERWLGDLCTRETKGKMSLNRDALQAANWRKARRSVATGECVEVAPVAGIIVVRDSKNPDGLVLQYSAASWRSFVTATKTDKNFGRS